MSRSMPDATLFIICGNIASMPSSKHDSPEHRLQHVPRGRSRRLAERAARRAARAAWLEDLEDNGNLPEPRVRPQAAPRRRFSINPILLLGVGAFSASLCYGIWEAHSEYRRMQAQVDIKKEKLTALKAQADVGKRRLAQLRADSTHEATLIDNGYIHPGDRILLFPPTPEEKRQTALPRNDMAPPVADENADAGGSLWQRAGHSLHRILHNDQDAAQSAMNTEPTDTTAANAATPDTLTESPSPQRQPAARKPVAPHRTDHASELRVN